MKKADIVEGVEYAWRCNSWDKEAIKITVRPAVGAEGDVRSTYGRVTTSYAPFICTTPKSMAGEHIMSRNVESTWTDWLARKMVLDEAAERERLAKEQRHAEHDRLKKLLEGTGLNVEYPYPNKPHRIFGTFDDLVKCITRGKDA